MVSVTVPCANTLPAILGTCYAEQVCFTVIQIPLVAMIPGTACQPPVMACLSVTSEQEG